MCGKQPINVRAVEMVDVSCVNGTRDSKGGALSTSRNIKTTQLRVRDVNEISRANETILRLDSTQSGVGRSTWSITRSSTGPLVDSSFNPSCSPIAVNSDGPFGSME